MRIKVDTISLASFFLLIWCLELVFPPLTVVTPVTSVCLICGMAWFALAFISNKHFFLKKTKNSFLAPMMFYVVAVVFSYAFSNTTVAHRYMAMMMLPFGVAIYGFYKEKNRIEDLKRVLFVTMIFITITFIRTLLGLLTNPYLVRSIKSSGEYSASLARQGIGSYGLVYMIVGMSVLLLYSALKTKGIKKIILFCIYVLSLFFIIKSNYMTSLLATVLCSAICLIVSLLIDKHDNVAMLFVKVLVIIVGSVCVLNFDQILNVFSGILPERISMVIDTNTNVMDSIWSEFIGDRFPVMMQSWATFLQHPILGGVGTGSVGMTGLYLSNVGQHSYILDTFAFFGIIIGLMNIYVVWMPFSIQKRKKGNVALRVSMIVCMICIYLLNNATESIALVFGIMYPFVDDLIISKAEK